MIKAWEVLEEAIPRGEAEDVAGFFGLTRSAVQKWRREPESGDGTGTGRCSPLDDILLLINAVFARHPKGADLIVDRIVSELEKLKSIHDRDKPIPLDRIEVEIREMQHKLGALANRVVGANRD